MTYGSILHHNEEEEAAAEEDLLLHLPKPDDTAGCSRGDLSSSSSSASVTGQLLKDVDDGDFRSVPHARPGPHCLLRRGHGRSQRLMMVVCMHAALAVVAAAIILAAAAAVTTTRQSNRDVDVAETSSSLSRQELLLPPHFLRTHPTAYENKMDQDDRLFFYGDDDIKLIRDEPHRSSKNKKKKKEPSQNSSNEDASPPASTTAPSETVEEQEVETKTTTAETEPPVVTPTEFTPIAGFTADLLDYDSPSLLHWYCEPGKDLCTSRSNGNKSEGNDEDGDEDEDDDLGYWGLVSSSRSDTPHYKLMFSPPPRHDFWRYTFYEPTLLKDDGSFLHTVVPQSSLPMTVSTSFTLHNPNSQFDAAGIMIRLDSNHWIKTGIEVVDQQPRVSCVVTNTYSDWSTQSYGPPIRSTSSSGPDSTKSSVRLQLRVHMLPRHGGSFVVEIVPYDDSSETSEEEGGDGEMNWTMIRMAHLNSAMTDPTSAQEDEETEGKDTVYEGPAAPDGSYMVGVYASSPVGTATPSMVAVFHSFTVSEGSDFDQGGF